MSKGTLIVFEGIDGSGKSTQYNLLCERFERESRDFLRLRFPRYDKDSSALIKMYLGGELGDSPDAVNAYAASSFYAVDRYASYLQDWRDYYLNGGLILADRYTTSNALHQGSKVSDDERAQFLKWLYEYEFDLLRLPRPDMVLYMNIDAELSGKRLLKRQSETGESRDIHELDSGYLKKCASLGREVADFYGWHSIDCTKDGAELGMAQLHDIVYDIVCRYL